MGFWELILENRLFKITTHNILMGISLFLFLKNIKSLVF